MTFRSDLPAALSSGPWLLRALQDGDWRLEQEMSRDPEVVRWTMYAPELTEEDARQLIIRTHDLAGQRSGGRYAVIDPGGEAIGTAGVVISRGNQTDAEVFYALLQRGRRRGAATAAARVLSDWAIAHGAQRVLLMTIVGNGASEAVARRAGFIPDGWETRDQRGQPASMCRWVRVVGHEPHEASTKSGGVPHAPDH